MGKGEAYSQTPGRARLRQPEPRSERAPALARSQSNRLVNKPPGLRELAGVEGIRVWHDQALIKAHRPRIILRTGPLEVE